MNMMESHNADANFSISNTLPIAVKNDANAPTNTNNPILAGPQAGCELGTKVAEVKSSEQNAYIEHCQGYINCAKESIRFLTEVNGLPFEHPLVVGIQEKIHKRMKMLTFHMIIQELAKHEELGTSPPEIEGSIAAHEQDVSNGTQHVSDTDSDFARDIAEQMYDMLYGENPDDSEIDEADEADDSDKDTSSDEGFHSD